MQLTHHNRHSFGLVIIILFFLLAVHLFALASVLFTFPTRMVLTFAGVSGLASTLFLVWVLVWVLGKLDGYQQDIAAATTHAAITTEELIVTKEQRADAMAQSKTLTKASKQQKKDASALKVANVALLKLNIEGNDKVNAAKTSLYREKAQHNTTKSALQSAEQTIVVLTASLAEVTAEGALKSDQVMHMTSQNDALVESVAAAKQQRDVAKSELAVKSAELLDQKEGAVVLAERLANATKSRVITRTKLAEAKLENGVLAQRLAACTRELDAASRELVAKDVVMAAQRSKTSKWMFLTMDQGDTNSLLMHNLEKLLAEFDDFRFHSELQLRSAAMAQATIVRLQEKVKNLQCAMVSLQLHKSTLSHAAAASAKHDATAGILKDSSTGTASTTLSGSVSRTNSDMSNSMSNSGDYGTVQPVIAASPIVALPSPSNAGAASAVIHTGPHNRPKRVKRQRQGQQHGRKTPSSANATKRKQAGLFRGYS